MYGLSADLAQAIVDGLPVMIPIVGSIALFGFLAVASWADSRRREREAFFRHELLKKIAENPGGEAQRVIDLLHQEQTDKLQRQRNMIRLGGWVTLGTGVGLVVMLSQLVPRYGVWAIGVLPALIGLALVLHTSTMGSRAKSVR